jgi:TetR/AcrR family transcriptional regulator, regulator of autoinduction and epiphytic fitness
MTTLKRTDRSRNLILDAADKAFREIGYSETSIEEIASRAGLTRKTVYNLFASKEDIAQRLIARVEAQDTAYRACIEADENAVALLDRALADSARWCLANPSLARLALSPAERPSLEPPPDRPSFQRLVRDILALGQRQGIIRVDEDAGFMALMLLAVFGQAMLTALSAGRYDEAEICKVARVLLEGIGEGTAGR